MADSIDSIAEKISDLIDSKLEDVKKYVRTYVGSYVIDTEQLKTGAVKPAKYPDNSIIPTKINIPLLFANEATIDQLKVATVGSLEAGTTVTINETTFNVNFDNSTGVFSITIGGTEEGQQIARIDETGGHFEAISVDDRVDCDMLAWRYDGATEFTNVTSFVDILDALNYCYLDSDISITLSTGLTTISEDVEFKGIHGPGSIVVYGSETASTAGISITGCTVKITFNSLYAAYTETRSPYCYYVDCTAESTYTASGTITAGANPTRTKRSGSTWKSDTDYAWQGYTDGMGRQYATFWFPGLSAYASATIKSASVRLKRVDGIGMGDSADVVAYTATNTSPSGDFSGKVSRGLLGTINNGETKTFTIPAAAATVLCSGGCLILDPGDTTTASGKVYSYNYCKYYGYGTGYAPVLTITYEIAGETVTAQSTFDRDNIKDPDWTFITPINGTTPGSYGNGALRWRREGNHVFVAGCVNVAWSAALEICELPYFPLYSNQSYFVVCNGANIACVDVKTNGQLWLEWVRRISDGAYATTFSGWVDINLDFWTD